MLLHLRQRAGLLGFALGEALLVDAEVFLERFDQRGDFLLSFGQIAARLRLEFFKRLVGQTEEFGMGLFERIRTEGLEGVPEAVQGQGLRLFASRKFWSCAARWSVSSFCAASRWASAAARAVWAFVSCVRASLISDSRRVSCWRSSSTSG
jgi:hypothetical protein